MPNNEKLVRLVLVADTQLWTRLRGVTMTLIEDKQIMNDEDDLPMRRQKEETN